MTYKISLQPGALYAAQKELNTSRDGLAREMGVASTTAFRVETGKVEPSTRFIAALMDVTGKPFEDLFQIETDVESGEPAGATS